MNIGRPEEQAHGSRKRAGGEFRKRDYALATMLFLVALLAPLRAAAEDSIALPSLPDAAAAHAEAEAFPAPPSGSHAQARREQTPEAETLEEQHEPFIADDVRTEGRMYAALEITASIEGSTFVSSRFTC